MRKSLILVLGLMLIFSSAVFAETKKNNVEITLGAFDPGSDYDGYFDTGADFSINFIHSFNDFLAIETGVHGYNTEMEDGWYWYGAYSADAEVRSAGLNLLGRLYKNFNGFRIYTGLGVGFYQNDIEIKAAGVTFYDESGSAVGVVGKAGFDYILSNGLYFGANVKRFTNKQEFEGSSEKLDLGGTSYGLTIGYNF